MITCKLATIMADRGVRHISDLSVKTGIARSTLTKLWYNQSDGIRFDTLNKLCEVLNCTPANLLVYTPENKTQTNNE
ncbi:XRE family transcriptional regulator [Thermoanaerobacteraceae bacterium SP2]|nr:XRE family transcriptional regulator [Thermoanaerobacteraceae bacterium SP2]